MKRIVTIGCALLALFSAKAQQKEGKVVYERTVQMQISFAGMNEEMQRMIPKSRTDRFDLTFGNNQSLWRQAEVENADDGTFASEGGGMQVRTVMAGSNDVLFTNFETGKRVEKRELFDKTFIVDDSVKALKWKMTGESKMILGHNCMKAEAPQISKRMQTTMDNGKMERKEVTDTSVVTAWFAADMPVPAGPAEFQGQLPGVILELSAGTRLNFKAVEISPKADIASIKEPTGKKRYTAAEFSKERDKMLKEMERSGGGPGGRTIRFGN